MKSNELIFNEATQRYEVRNSFNSHSQAGLKKQIMINGKWQTAEPALKKRIPYSRKWNTSYVKSVPLKNLKVRVKK